MTDKPKLTDAEFDVLKQKRDEAINGVVDALCKEQGWPRDKITFHASGLHGCYCACPGGPCQHRWDGPEQVVTDDYDRPCGSTKTCSKCGADAMSHDVRTSDF
jgi:hypothetical protein